MDPDTMIIIAGIFCGPPIYGLVVITLSKLMSDLFSQQQTATVATATPPTK